MNPTITIANGGLERKDVAEQIEARKRRLAEKDKQQAEALRTPRQGRR